MGLRARRGWCSRWSLIGAWALAGSAWAAGGNEPLTTAEMLVAAAQDHALGLQGKQTAADVQHVQTLLQAAVRLDPQRADAWTWLYELASLRGDEAEAGRMLNGLLEADPTHEGAFALWLAAGVQAQQTIEKRVEWLNEVLQTQSGALGSPAPLHAMVHVQLALLARERLDTEAARREVDRALELEPASIDGRLLAYEMLPEDAPGLERLRAALRVLEVMPLSLEAAWRVAVALDEFGFVAEAARFFEYGRSIHQRVSASAELPPGFLLDYAHNRLAAGSVGDALELALRASHADGPLGLEAGLFAYYLCMRQNLRQQAGELQAYLGHQFAAVKDTREHSTAMLAQTAWYYCVVEPQPQRAVKLARAAAQRAPADRFARRVLGWALANDLKSDEAREILASVAGRDAYAAYQLANLANEAGDPDEARRALAALSPRPTAGLANDLIRMLETKLDGAVAGPIAGGDQGGLEPAATQPTSQAAAAEETPESASGDGPSTGPQGPPAEQPTTQPGNGAAAASAVARGKYPEMAAALDGFEAEVLNFCEAPGRYLAASVKLDDLAPAPGEPWRATLSLTNRGRFPITLGPEGMVNPVLLLSYGLEGDRRRFFPGLTTISLDTVRVLDPGETVQARRWLNVGPVRQAMRQTPQHTQRVVLEVLVDAEKGRDGRWRPGVGGQSLPTVYFNRVAASVGRDALTAYFAALTGEKHAERVKAIEVLTVLLGERQQADLRRLGYQPGPAPTDRIRAALLRSLTGENWELRARTLDALQIAGLDRELFDAVEQCLDHPHWLVRLLAVRVLARQGPDFASRAMTLAQYDTDELVRAMAGSYVMQWRKHERQSATQPAPVAEDDR